MILKEHSYKQEEFKCNLPRKQPCSSALTSKNKKNHHPRHGDDLTSIRCDYESSERTQ